MKAQSIQSFLVAFKRKFVPIWDLPVELWRIIFRPQWVLKQRKLGLGHSEEFVLPEFLKPYIVAFLGLLFWDCYGHVCVRKAVLEDPGFAASHAGGPEPKGSTATLPPPSIKHVW